MRLVILLNPRVPVEGYHYSERSVGFDCPADVLTDKAAPTVEDSDL